MRIPKVVYGTPEVEFIFSKPQKFWTPASRPHGGGNVSDSGVPESFIIRRDQLVYLELRFTEAEWPDFASWIETVQDGSAFDFWFDYTDDTTRYTVYLEEPSIGDGEIRPDRDEYNSVFSHKVVLRSTSSTRFNVRV